MKLHVALLLCLFSLTAVAQQQAPPNAPAPPKPAAPPTAPAPPQPPQVIPDSERGGQPANIRLDVSVIEQTAQGAIQPKSLMVMLVDRAVGRTRAAFEDRSVAVDARPVLIDGRIRVSLTIQSDQAHPMPTPTPPDPTLAWRNSFSLLLENGKPMLALETADAATKRKMSIEVKATILK